MVSLGKFKNDCRFLKKGVFQATIVIILSGCQVPSVSPATSSSNDSSISGGSEYPASVANSNASNSPADVINSNGSTLSSSGSAFNAKGTFSIPINSTLLSPTFAFLGPYVSDGLPFAARLAFINASSDGYSDLALFSPNYVNGVIDRNHSNVLVYSGKNQSLLFKLTGDYSFGRSLDSAGDFNHDGVDDVFVGAPSCAGCGGLGKVFVYSSKDQSLIFSMSGSVDSLLGWVVAGVGDVNGDGYDDILVTDPSFSNNRGIVYVISGQDHSSFFTMAGENEGDYFGQSASRIGDLDGDGLPDIIIGTRDFQSKVTGAQLNGKVYAYSPKANHLIWSKTGVPFDGLGIGVSSAGDFNGDGTPDVIAQAGISNRVYVLSGADGSFIYQKNDIQPYYFGLNTGSLGDIEGTGYSSIAIGDMSTGTVQIVSGKKKTVIATMSANTADVMGSLGAVVVGGSNFNGDGKPNLAIAAINARASMSDGNPRGKVYVVSPKDLIRSLK